MVPRSARPARSALAGALAAAGLLLTACGGSDEPTDAAPQSSASAGAPAELLAGQRLTVLDQPISYPSGKQARITSEVVELQPGQQTGWQRQRTPTYVYVLAGTWSEEYDAGVTKDFPQGTAFMQAQGVWHNGSNTGEDVARVLVVHMGAKGVKDTAVR